MITFKNFLQERDQSSGKSTAKYGTKRANASDISAALDFVSKTIGVPVEKLRQNLLGSANLTIQGKRDDSGDVDIALPVDENDPQEVHDKMIKAISGEGEYRSGSKIGSYAVPVKGKKVQVDLMFVKNEDWAKFIYHSSGDSKYPGAVRNIILFTTLAYVQEPNKDFVIRDDEGKPIARASRSIHMDSGMKRLFKMAKVNQKTGKRKKTLDSVSPDELAAYLKEIGKDIKFSSDVDLIDDPDQVAAFIFGEGVKANNIMTAEDVIKHLKKLPNADEIIEASKSELERNDLPIPSEL